jgi:hypothetical protein
LSVEAVQDAATECKPPKGEIEEALVRRASSMGYGRSMLMRTVQS